MKPPRSIRIGASRFAVQPTKVLRDAADGTNGVFIGSAGVILIAGDLGFDQERETLLHEVLHGIIDATGQRGQDTDKEEKLVASLSPVLFGVIRDNPKLVAYLQEVQ